MTEFLPVGKLDMQLLSGLLEKYTSSDEYVKIGARVGEDAAVVDFGDRYLVTKTNPITFATQQIGWYVVHVCVNNMVVRGVRPRWMLNCILLPEGKTTPGLVEQIFRQIYEAGKEVGVEVIGGHTEVTYGLDRPIIAGHLIGEIAKEELVATGAARPGEAILVTKALGVEATAILAGELGEELQTRGYAADFIERAQNFLHDPGISVYRDALAAAETGAVKAMTDATEGGLATALHELASAAGIGVRVERDKIPLYPETQTICSEFGLDPMGVIASGMLIMTAEPGDAPRIVKALRDVGIDCTEIGVVTPPSEGLMMKQADEWVPLPYFSSDEITRAL